MAEVQTSVTSGEMAARFIEFVRMHAHNAGLCLGRVPHPRTGKPEVNLDLARVLIEQLAAIELKTRGNLNNHIGVPLTLLSIEPETEFAVVEMGMSDFREIALLSDIARPDAAVVTNIGDAHLAQLGSRSGIAQAKLEILQGLADGGLLVVPGGEPLIAQHLPAGAAERWNIVTFGEEEGSDVRLASVELGERRTKFRIAGSPVEFSIPMPGRHNARNALAAVAAARYFGASDEAIAAGLSAFTPTGMRVERVAAASGAVIWNDAYNASPTSMRAALDLLGEIKGFRRKFAVLGDMLELGPAERELHREIGKTVDPARIDFVYAFGSLGAEIAEAAAERFPPGAVKIFASKEELAGELERTSGEGDLILVKASRGMEMETIVERLRADRPEGGERWN